MSTTNDSITFKTEAGVSSNPMNRPQDDIDSALNYRAAKLNGIHSLYVVYDRPNYQSGKSAPAIVDTTDSEKFAFDARSTRGWDKKGIAVFEKSWFAYQSFFSNISVAEFAELESGSAESFIVMEGTWMLYPERQFGGKAITIDGIDTFGPGTRLYFLGKDVIIRSIKRVQTNK